MKDFIDYELNNDYTDEKEWGLTVRVMADGFSFGWYTYAGSSKPVSDSQFDVGQIAPQDAEEILQNRFNAYYISQK